MMLVPELRVARPSDDPDAPLPFHEAGLALGVLFRFTDHDGFDGVMVKRAGASCHLVFTRRRGHAAGRAQMADNPLVFYLPRHDEWTAAVERMRAAGFEPVPAFNPYRDRRGATFEDPDGDRVVLQQAAWSVRPPPGPGRGSSPEA